MLSEQQGPGERMDDTDPTQTGVPIATPPPATPPYQAPPAAEPPATVPPTAAPSPPSLPPAASPGQPPAPPNGRARRRNDGRAASLVFGVLLLLVGLWFFATRTLGLDLPRLEWGRLWPLFLIALGLWIAFRSFERRR
jgi:hypothetical protein